MIDPKELKVNQVILFYELTESPTGYPQPFVRNSRYPIKGTVLGITPYGFIRIHVEDGDTKWFYEPKLIEVVEIL
jgi:hypothetical protein